MKVGVINYGVGNLGSVIRALDSLNVSPFLIDRAQDLHLVDRLILPGVGSFLDCKSRLDVAGWTESIRSEVISNKKPLLGICLGMHLLADFGTEGAEEGGETPGLGLIPGRVVSLRSIECKLRVPHMGWNSVEKTHSSKIFKNISSGTDFYFVHGYTFLAASASNVTATVRYGVDFVAAISNDHIHGVQFHPEKSSRAGFQVIKNFIES
jgi:glutamine amidotransferase